MGKIFIAQGQVTVKQMVWSAPQSNSSKFVNCKFDEDLIKNEGATYTFSIIRLWNNILSLKGEQLWSE